MSGGRQRVVHLLVGLVGLAGCKKDEITWVAFNASGEEFVVDVLPEGSPVGEPAELDLASNLGTTTIGHATMDPDSGPVGTVHLLTVEVFDDYQDMVGRATVEVKSEAVSDLNGDGEPDARDNDGYEMRRDSADPGWFAIELQSLGAADEERQDVFTLHLWTADELVGTGS